MIITIDGPAASGKSTVARSLADTFGLFYLNSGFLFRGLAYILLESTLYTEETMSSVLPADVDYFLDPHILSYSYTSMTGPSVCSRGHTITDRLKTEPIDRAASLLSTNWYVRTKLYDIQRSFAQEYSLVIDGRDTGSVAFPDADYKFFITAEVAVRAQRWQADQAKKGAHFSLEQALAEIKRRDKRDSEREHAPLLVADDAHIIDTSHYTIAQTLERVISYLPYTPIKEEELL